MTDAPDPAARLLDADRDAALARRRVTTTLNALQARLAPGRVVDHAAREVRAVGQASADAVGENRGVLIGVGAALGLFALRGPLGRLFRRRPVPPAETAEQPPR